MVVAPKSTQKWNHGIWHTFTIFHLTSQYWSNIHAECHGFSDTFRE